MIMKHSWVDKDEKCGGYEAPEYHDVGVCVTEGDWDMTGDTGDINSDNSTPHHNNTQQHCLRELRREPQEETDYIETNPK